jgi:hypothetical protein
MFHQLGSGLDHFHQNRPRFHQNRQKSTENPPQIAPVYIYILLQDVMLQTHSSPRREAASSPLLRCTTVKKSKYIRRLAVTCEYLQLRVQKQRHSKQARGCEIAGRIAVTGPFCSYTSVLARQVEIAGRIAVTGPF